jgi:hypothetical protein
MTVFLVLAVGLLNFCLGYALAVRMGLGPSSLAEAWETILAEPSDRAAHATEPQQNPNSTDVAESASKNEDAAGWPLQELILPPDWQEEGESESESASAHASAVTEPA